MTRFRVQRLVMATVGSTVFGALMLVTYYGLVDIAVEDRRTIPPAVYAMPLVAGLAVSAMLFLVAAFERPVEQTWAWLHRPQPDAPRDDRFIRAYRIGRRASAVGRNRFEAARIRQAALDGATSIR